MSPYDYLAARLFLRGLRREERKEKEGKIVAIHVQQIVPSIVCMVAAREEEG